MIADTEISQNTCGDESSDSKERHVKISQLAYFKAEQRGFVLGHELEDWLLAEREVLLSECSHAYLKPKAGRISLKKVE